MSAPGFTINDNTDQAPPRRPRKSSGPGFVLGLVLGIAIGFGAGVLVEKKGCPPVPVPGAQAAASMPEAMR